MSDFGKKLHEYLLAKEGYSISAFAKDIGISAGLLNHIFNGKRTITRDKLLLTLNNRAFTPEEKACLRELYFSSVYSGSLFKKMRLLDEMLTAYDFNNDMPLPEASKDDSDDVTLLQSQQSVLSAIHSLFKNSQGRVFTNIAHKNNDINALLFSLKKSYGEKELCRFITKIKADCSRESITELFSVIRFAQLGVITVSLEKECLISLDELTVFPYFIISSEEMILLDSSCRSGARFKDESIVSKNYSVIGKKYSFCKKAVNLFNHELDMVKYTLAYESGECFNYNYLPSFTGHSDISYLFESFDKNDINKIKVEAFLKNRNKSRKFTYYISLRGVEDFVEKGRCYLAAQNHLPVFSTSGKIAFLESLYETIKSSKDFSYSIFGAEYPFSEFLKSLHIQVNESSVVIYSMKLPADGDSFLGQVVLSLPSGDLSHSLAIYLKSYLPLSGELIPKESAMVCLSSMIIDCIKKETQQ